MHTRSPMLAVWVDLFDAIGKKWLVMVDRCSGYLWLAELNKTCTSKVTGQLKSWFAEYGWPNVIRTDGGPQFGSEFQDFCKTYNCKHKFASTYNPESNGLAKAAVKNMKCLVTRTRTAKENLPEAIAAWRNMPPSDGKSPSQIFFRSRQKHALPLTLNLMKYDTADNKSLEQRYKDEIRNQNKHTKVYPSLEIVQKVLIQHHSSGEWYKQATVTQVRADAKSYWLINSEGRKYPRRRRLIKPNKRNMNDKI